MCAAHTHWVVLNASIMKLWQRLRIEHNCSYRLLVAAFHSFSVVHFASSTSFRFSSSSLLPYDEREREKPFLSELDKEPIKCVYMSGKMKRKLRTQNTISHTHKYRS